MALNNSNKKTKKDVRMTESQEPTEAAEPGSGTSPKTNRVKCYLFSWGEFVDTDIALSRRADWCRERGLDCCLFGQQEVDMAQGGEAFNLLSKRVGATDPLQCYIDKKSKTAYCFTHDATYPMRDDFEVEACPVCKKPIRND